MAYKLQLKRGVLASLPNGSVGEPLFTTDTFDLYVGKGDGTNVKIQKFIASGSSSQFLKGDGSLDSNTYIGLTALSASAPLSYNNTTGAFTISQAGGSTNGYLSSGDWTTFNAKQAALSGSGIVKSTGGTISYLTDNSANWDTAYNDKINSASVSGTTTKTLTLTQQDGGTITTSWSDYDTAPVTSVFGRTGDVVAANGDYTTSQVTEGTNLYYTDARARAAITLTTTGSSGASTYVGGTLNIPTYTLAGLGGVASSRQLNINGTSYDLSADRTWSVGTVTSVNMSVPTGFAISGNPITSSGTLALAFAAGYSLPTTSSQANWDAAYNDKINSASVTGTTTKTLTLTQQDGGTITASWTDDNTDAVSSVFGRTGAVVAQSGDYTTTQVTEGTNLYYTDARSRAALSFVAGSGAYNSTTGVITIPTNTNQLSNGASFITLASLSGGAGISYNNTTGVIASTITQYTDAMARASISGGTGISYNSTTGVITNTITQYTDAMARASLSFAAGSGAYNSTTGVITIPTNTNQLTNGAAFITLGSLSASAPLSYNNGTGAFSISQASSTTNGFLSSTDWNTFNNKQNAITLTTTGTSGAATLVGSTLNIPQYQSVITNPVTGTGTTNYLPKWTSGSALGNSNLYGGTTGFALNNTLNASGYAIEFESNALTPRIDLVVNGSYEGGLSSNSTGTTLKSTSTNPLIFTINSSEKLRVTNSGLIGIGTSSPGYKVDVYNVGGGSAGTRIYGNDQSNVRLRLENANGRTWELTGGLTGANNNTFTIYDATAAATRLQLDSSGNLGLGVVPSAWGSGGKLQVGSGQTIGSVGNGFVLASNWYYNAGDKFAGTGYASYYNQQGGTHTWNTSTTSGNVGDTATMTQAMTLNASGNLLVGTTTDTGQKLQVNGALRINAPTGSAAPGAIALSIRDASSSTYGFDFNLEGVSTGDLYLMRTNNSVQSTVLQIARATGAATFSSSVTAGGILYSRQANYPQIVFQETTSSTDALIFYDNVAATKNMGFRVNSGSNVMTLTSSNVGIGTTSPTYKLDVLGSLRGIDGSSYTALYLYNQKGSSGGTAAIQFGLSDGGFVTSDAARVEARIIDVTNSAIDLKTYGVSGLTTKMSVLGNGNVGIGTTSPGEKLTINGGLGFQYNGTQTWHINTNSSNNLLFTRSGIADRMTLSSDGNLGLGVTPSAWLSGTTVLQIGSVSAVTDDSVNKQSTFWNNTFVNTAGVPNYLTTAAASFYRQTNGVHLWYNAPSGTAGNAITFTQAMTLDASGRLGIGTTSPGDRLQVDGNVYANAFHAVGSIARFVSGGGTFIAGLNGSSYGYIQSYSDTSGTGRALAINPSGGNVGIGTTSPGQTLSIRGGASATLFELKNSSDSAIGYLGVASQSGNIFTGSSANDYCMRGEGSNILFGFSTTERMRITSGGNVGIGTTNPTEKLHVNGNIKTAAPTGYTAGSWKLGTANTGTVTANRYITIEIDGQIYTINALLGTP